MSIIGRAPWPAGKGGAIEGQRASNNIACERAFNDLMDLAARGLGFGGNVGREWFYTAANDLRDRPARRPPADPGRVAR